MSRVKSAEKIVCFCFPFRIFFRILSENFSDYWPTKFQQFFKNYLLRVQRNNLWLEIFFVKFWIFLDFLQKLLAWFSKVYLSVQSKNCGKKKFFFLFFSRIFSTFEQKFFRLLAKKLQQFFKNYLLRVQRNNLWLEFFFVKFWTVSDFLQKLLAWFSNFYLRVQSKNCGKNSLFLFSFQNFFSNFERKFFRLLANKISTIFQKLPSTCPEEQFVAWIFFCKVLNLFGFSAEAFGMVLKILSTCPE